MSRFVNEIVEICEAKIKDCNNFIRNEGEFPKVISDKTIAKLIKSFAMYFDGGMLFSDEIKEFIKNTPLFDNGKPNIQLNELLEVIHEFFKEKEELFD
jgi:hypothetical protein